MIKLIREMGNQEKLSRLIEKCIEPIEQSFHMAEAHYPRYMYSTLTIELLKSGCEIDNHHIPKSLVTYVKYLLTEERNRLLLPRTDLGILILKFAHKIDSQEIIDIVSKDYLPAVLQAQKLVPIDSAVELLKLIVQQQRTYSRTELESYYHKNITIERCRLGSLPLDTILDLRHLTQIFGNKELAQQIDTRLGLQEANETSQKEG